MATPLTPAQMIAALDKWGVRYNLIPGWETRGRNYVGHGAWGPVIGCIVHHTGDDAPDDADLRIVRDGRSDLSGPLAQFGGRDDGSIDVIASGRANHAGTGDPAVYAAVKAQSYGDYPPPTHYHQGSTGGTDGNTYFYGVETYYSGSHAPAPVQYRAVVLLYAAICDAHGWTAKAVIGHKEWSDWKSDPGQVDMRQMRDDVTNCLTIGPAAAAAWAYGSLEDDMPLTDADAQRVAYWVLNGTSLDGGGTLSSWVKAARIDAGQAKLEAAAARAVAEQVAAKGSTLTVDDVRAAVDQAIADGAQVTGTLTVEPRQG